MLTLHRLNLLLHQIRIVFHLFNSVVQVQGPMPQGLFLESMGIKMRLEVINEFNI